jgi:chromosome segregation ATPase
VRFEQQHTSVIYEFKNKTDEFDNIINQKKSRIEELKKKIEDVRSAREKDEIEAQKIKEDNNELTNQNRIIKSNQDVTANNISKLKAQKESLEEKIINTKLMITNNKDECTRLRTLLVHNPEEFQNVINNLNNSLNDKRQQCANTDKRIQELQASMHKMQALKDIIKESIKSVKECQDNINEFKSFQKKTRDESEKLDKVNSDVANLEMENGQLDQTYKSLEDMEKNMNEKKIHNMRQHDKKMEELKQQYQKVREMYVLKMIDCDKHQKIVQELDNKTNILREQIKSDMSALNSAYNKLKSQVDGYLSEIQVSLKENI